MIAYKIREGIYWVGAIDWHLRLFHGYSTDKGTTYNAYLILDEKITLIDNVKAEFTEELIARISSVIDPSIKIEVHFLIMVSSTIVAHYQKFWS